MNFRSHTVIFTLTLMLMGLVAGCGTSGVSIREGKKPANRQDTSTIDRNAALVVHVDMNERITTIRRGYALSAKYLVSMTPSGVETAVLKSRFRSAEEGLMTADILEGEPLINNFVVPASAERSKKLSRLYPDNVE